MPGSPFQQWESGTCPSWFRSQICWGGTATQNMGVADGAGWWDWVRWDTALSLTPSPDYTDLVLVSEVAWGFLLIQARTHYQPPLALRSWVRHLLFFLDLHTEVSRSCRGSLCMASIHNPVTSNYLTIIRFKEYGYALMPLVEKMLATSLLLQHHRKRSPLYPLRPIKSQLAYILQVY